MRRLTLNNPQDILSPGLLIDPGLIQSNIDQMIAMVGGPGHVNRLRPHLKTYKMAEVVRMQIDTGIDKFKAATIAEAAMAANEGANDVLLAHQPVGPKIGQLAELVAKFQATSFAAIVDDIGVVETLANRLGSDAAPFRLFIDVDCGMGRTGICFGDHLDQLRAHIDALPGITFAGLHVYDGHLHDQSLADRQRKAGAIVQRVRDYVKAHDTPTVIAGGSPTFGVWASEASWQCSPGTTLLWDVGYGRSYPDLSFAVTAALITRVVSKPGHGRICVDLGHKAVAAERPLDQRVWFPDWPDAVAISQSEEHLVLEVPDASSIAVGDAFVGYPIHICPTVALHATASIVSGGQATGEVWRVAARDR